MVVAAAVVATELGVVQLGAEVFGAGLVVGALLGAQQMVQPSLTTETSLLHVKFEPAATATPFGPVLP